jgi:hypothetical protein
VLEDNKDRLYLIQQLFLFLLRENSTAIHITITVLNILLLTGRKNDDLKIESSVENKRNRRLKIPRFLELNQVYKL